MREQKVTVQALRQMQALPTSIKVTMAKQRIKDYYDHFQGNVYISFSGGKDSTALLHLARSMYPDIKAVYVDTGLEYPEVKAFIKTVENVEIIRPKMYFKDVINKYGYPVPSKELAHKIYYARKGSEWALKFLNGENLDHNGKKSAYNISEKWKKLYCAPFNVSDRCCYIMKKQPFREYDKRTGMHGIVASMACESVLRQQQWNYTGCNSFDGKIISKPFSFWLENDVLTYIVENNIKMPIVYGDIVEVGLGYDTVFKQFYKRYTTTGVKRTGCIYCMFGVHLEKSPNRFERLRITHPALYDWCLKSQDEGGLGLQEVLDYCEIKY